MEIFKLKKMNIWLLVNIFLQIIAPLCFALLFNIVVSTGKGLGDLFELIFYGGAYIFLGLFVLISLVPHFFERTFEKENSYRSILILYVVVTVIVLFITCFLYLSFLSLIPIEEIAVPFTENSKLSIIVTISSVIVAIIFKMKILYLQKNINHISNKYIPS